MQNPQVAWRLPPPMHLCTHLWNLIALKYLSRQFPRGCGSSAFQQDLQYTKDEIMQSWFSSSCAITIGWRNRILRYRMKVSQAYFFDRGFRPNFVPRSPRYLDEKNTHSSIKGSPQVPASKHTGNKSSRQQRIMAHLMMAEPCAPRLRDFFDKN